MSTFIAIDNKITKQNDLFFQTITIGTKPCSCCGRTIKELKEDIKAAIDHVYDNPDQYASEVLLGGK